MDKRKNIELLSPAKDLATGMAAINHGADAVYIGTPKYGARAAAGNSLKDVAKLINYAHKYWAKVYITLNTILYDNELDEACSIAKSVYDAGADALIIQDMAFMEMDLPPIPLFASTQTHNYALDKILFFEKVGFQRIILARELSLNQLKEIRANTNIELECFIYGALCVSFSGQCYLSEATQGRSANRGECAQPCRLPYTLINNNGKVIERNKYLLSLKDLNLSEYIDDLINAGITSFKIEGRLKDINYVKNVTAFFRKKIDEIIEKDGVINRSSSGRTYVAFNPALAKTFNRGFTDHFLNHRSKEILSPLTPKSIGAYLGKVERVGKGYFVLQSKESVINGDGICFFNNMDELQGTNINKVEGKKIYPADIEGIETGAIIYRNYDHIFIKELQTEKTKRLISIEILFKEIENGFLIKAKDKDEVEVEIQKKYEKKYALKQNAEETIRKQLTKLGNTLFVCDDVKIEWSKPYFLPVAVLNELRRELISKLERERQKLLPKSYYRIARNNVPYPEKHLSYLANVSNKKAQAFYKRHGIETIEPAFEKQGNIRNAVIMTMKHCLRYQYDLCLGRNVINVEPLYLTDAKNRYRLEFDCKMCLMKLVLE